MLQKDEQNLGGENGMKTEMKTNGTVTTHPQSTELESSTKANQVTKVGFFGKIRRKRSVRSEKTREAETEEREATDQLSLRRLMVVRGAVGLGGVWGRLLGQVLGQVLGRRGDVVQAWRRGWRYGGRRGAAVAPSTTHTHKGWRV